MSERNLNCAADLIFIREFPNFFREKLVNFSGDRVDTLRFIPGMITSHSLGLL